MKGSNTQRCFDKLHLVFSAPLLLFEIKPWKMKELSINFWAKEHWGRLMGKEARWVLSTLGFGACNHHMSSGACQLLVPTLTICWCGSPSSDVSLMQSLAICYSQCLCRFNQECNGWHSLSRSSMRERILSFPDVRPLLQSQRNYPGSCWCSNTGALQTATGC